MSEIGEQAMPPASKTSTTDAMMPRRWSERPAALVLVGLLIVAGAGGLWLTGDLAGRAVAVRLALGLAGSVAIGLFARRRRWLTTGGLLGAVLTGTLIVGGGGATWGGLLIVFFVLSSLLSRWRRRSAGPAVTAAKGATRDLGQVLANGGLATLLAVMAAVWPTPALFVAYVGALAAVTADTWASEIGALSRRPPRLLTTGRAVPPGTDGGVTGLGLLASIAGGLTIGAVALLLAPAAVSLGEVTTTAPLTGWLPLLGLLGGLGGSLADSLLGATLQGVRWCPACQVETERERHVCGAATLPRRGWPWLDNDRVNLLASVAGAVIAVALGHIRG